MRSWLTDEGYTVCGIHAFPERVTACPFCGAAEELTADALAEGPKHTSKQPSSDAGDLGIAKPFRKPA